MLTTTLFRRTIPKLSYGFITHPIHLRPAPFSSYYSCLSSHIPLAFDHFTPPPSSAKTTDRANPEILKSVNSDHQVVSSSVHQNHPNEWNKPIHQPILILHGLFGSRQNWRTLAKKLAHKSQREVFVLDLRNHGESGATPGSTSYMDYATDIEAFIDSHQLKNVNLIGHSMGGKVAMSVALRPSGPSIINKLVIVDISPLKGRISDDFQSYLEGMKQINLKKIKTRKEADEILAKFEKQLEVRQFLLTNLKKIEDPISKQDQFKIRLPLETLSEQILSNQVGDFPFEPHQPDPPQFSNPTLFIKGKTSKYINRHCLPSMNTFFPGHNLIEFDAGHWVHAEKPNEFLDAVTGFFEGDTNQHLA